MGRDRLIAVGRALLGASFVIAMGMTFVVAGLLAQAFVR